MKKLLSALAICATCFAGSASAVSVTVGTKTYEITTITGGYGGARELLMSQEWFGNGGLAAQIALALGSELGKFPSFGPSFAYADQGFDSGAPNLVSTKRFADGNGVLDILEPDGYTGPWAIAATAPQVPLPATLPLMSISLLGLRLLRRK